MSFDAANSMNDHAFYKAFEDRFRGSRELITNRLQIYIPYLRPLVNGQGEGQAGPVAIDLGCGRCEWLDLLQEQGFATIGVDTNPEMTAAHATQHQLIRGDAVSSLSAMESSSASVISAFHLVEHIPFPQTIQLLTQALRVLRPGGLMIIETPNIESLDVLTRFHLDPTHLRPLPADLLSFACEFYGYSRHVCIRPLDDPSLPVQRPATMPDLFYSLSGDLGLVAQKARNASNHDDPWETMFAPPLRLDNRLLLSAIETRIETRISQLESTVRHSFTLRLERWLRRIKASIRVAFKPEPPN